jgi:hypothetical protein
MLATTPGEPGAWPAPGGTGTSVLFAAEDEAMIIGLPSEAAGEEMAMDGAGWLRQTVSSAQAPDPASRPSDKAIPFVQMRFMVSRPP